MVERHLPLPNRLSDYPPPSPKKKRKPESKKSSRNWDSSVQPTLTSGMGRRSAEFREERGGG
jgi:hypothetical protein